jgi:hypothetical protein
MGYWLTHLSFRSPDPTSLSKICTQNATIISIYIVTSFSSFLYNFSLPFVFPALCCFFYFISWIFIFFLKIYIHFVEQRNISEKRNLQHCNELYNVTISIVSDITHNYCKSLAFVNWIRYIDWITKGLELINCIPHALNSSEKKNCKNYCQNVCSYEISLK